LIDCFTRQQIGRQFLAVIVATPVYVVSADKDERRHGYVSTFARKFAPVKAAASLLSIFSAQATTVRKEPGPMTLSAGIDLPPPPKDAGEIY
jgi:hypothetical protein